MSTRNHITPFAHYGASSKPNIQPQSGSTTPEPEALVNPTGCAAKRERTKPRPWERRARLSFLCWQAAAQGIDVLAHIKGRPLIHHLEAAVVNIIYLLN